MKDYTKEMILIICLTKTRKHNKESFLIDEDFNIIKKFPKTYTKAGDYIPSVGDLIEKGIRSIVFPSFEEGVRSIMLERKLQDQIKSGKKFLSNKQIDDVIERVMKEELNQPSA